MFYSDIFRIIRSDNCVTMKAAYIGIAVRSVCRDHVLVASDRLAAIYITLMLYCTIVRASKIYLHCISVTIFRDAVPRT